MKKSKIIVSIAAGALTLAVAVGGFSALADEKVAGSKPAAGFCGGMAGARGGMQGQKGGMGFGNVKIAATVLGISEDEVMAAVKEGTSIGQQMINAGKLEEFKTAVIAQLDERHDKMKSEIQNWDGTTDMMSARPEGAGMQKGGGMMGFGDIKTAASVLGISEDEVTAAVKEGTSIGQQMVNAGKLDAYKAAVLAECKTRLDAVVADGKMDQAMADERYADMESKVNAWDGTGNMAGAPNMKDNHKKGGMGGRMSPKAEGKTQQ